MKIYETTEGIEHSDFYLAAYLIASGFPLKNYIVEDEIAIFRFEESNQIDAKINEYYSLTGSINPTVFVSAIKSIKSLIHNAIRSGHKSYYTKPRTNNDKV